VGFSFKVKKDQLPENSVANEGAPVVEDSTVASIPQASEEPSASSSPLVSTAGLTPTHAEEPAAPAPPPIEPQSSATLLPNEKTIGFKLESQPNVEVQNSQAHEEHPQASDTTHEHADHDKTVAMPKDSSFLERSKMTGIAPPPRAGTVTGLIVADRKKTERVALAAKVFGVLAVPAIAGAVFFFLSGNDQPEHAAVAPAPIAKNPSKKPDEVKVKKETKVAPVAPKPAFVYGEAPIDGNAASQALALMSVGMTPAHEPRPVIKLSIQPPMSARGSIPRDSAAMVLTRQEYGLLSKWIEQDPSAKFFFEEWVRTAREAVPVPTAPVADFKLTTPEDRTKTAAALAELARVRSLHLGLLVTGDQAMLAKLREIVVAWAKTYQSTGDAILDSQLEPLMEAYGTYSKSFLEPERALVDQWMLKIADSQATESIARLSQDDRWYAHHLKTMALVGFSTGNAKIQEYVKLGFGAHIARAVIEDGQTTTYHQSHSIQLHTDHLVELLKVSILFDRVGQGTAEVTPVPGSSLARSINFCLPYIIGKIDHTEYDPIKDPELKARQDAGDPIVAIHPFKPENTLPFLEVLLYFRPSLAQEVAQLNLRPGTRFSTQRGLYFASMVRRIPIFDPAPIAASTVRAPATPTEPLLRQIQQKQPMAPATAPVAAPANPPAPVPAQIPQPAAK
jgi:hypothetical protein